jgi:hypothetical protein
MPTFLKLFTEARKFGVALATGLAAVVSTGALDGDALKTVVAVIAFLGSIGVYAIPNKPAA